jgi:NADPH:quinone reductase-like Zn-dependent oxidoreductase
MQTTEAWVLYAGERNVAAELRREAFALGALGDGAVLAEPLFGCWEANMSHALARQPVDICRERGEPRVVIGNAGVVRVLKVGPGVTGLREGDACLLSGSSDCDDAGYMVRAFGYDAPNTIGLLARRTILPASALIAISPRSRHSLRHWAAFSIRYVTAWGNWRVAHGCWSVQMSEEDLPDPCAWGWGGGSSFAELTLAQARGWRGSMIAGSDARLAMIERAGLAPIDRRRFGTLDFDEPRFASDPAYRAGYLAAEDAFLRCVRERTGGRGVSIFVDHIGAPVTRATLRALARQGVLTTAGWKHGMRVTSMRSVECIQRHIHVHTHYARRSEAVAAMHYAEQTGWMAPLGSDERIYGWDEIPELARDYERGLDTYFPIFRINAV